MENITTNLDKINKTIKNDHYKISGLADYSLTPSDKTLFRRIKDDTELRKSGSNVVGIFSELTEKKTVDEITKIIKSIDDKEQIDQLQSWKSIKSEDKVTLDFTPYNNSNAKDRFEYYGRLLGAIAIEIVIRFKLELPKKFQRSDLWNSKKYLFTKENVNPILKPLGLEVSADRKTIVISSGKLGEELRNFIENNTSQEAWALRQKVKKTATVPTVSFKCEVEGCDYRASTKEKVWKNAGKPTPECMYDGEAMVNSSKYGKSAS